MVRRKKDKEAKALYYPFIEVSDLSWLLGAVLFWDEISTITHNEEQPYNHPTSRTLADAGVLVPYRSSPHRREVMDISERVVDLLGNAAFESVIGRNNWVSQHARRYTVHPDKIESNLRHVLERLGRATTREDGLMDMETGLAKAYIMMLAVEVAGQKKYSLVTDQHSAFQFTEAVRFQDKINTGDDFLYHRSRRDVEYEFVNACVSEMMLTWFRIDPDSDPEKIVKYKKKRRDELKRMRNAVFRANSGILTDEDLSYDSLRKKAKQYVHSEIRPAYDDLKKTLKEERINFLPGALKAALYAEMPGGLVAAVGQAWALFAAPICGIVIKGITHLASRQATLQNSPWSYLYMAEKKIGMM